jgi:hypothetical protein
MNGKKVNNLADCYEMGRNITKADLVNVVVKKLVFQRRNPQTGLWQL